MKISIAAALLLIFISGCNKGTGSHDAKSDGGKPPAGYEEAKLICTQCHSLPSPDQFHPAAWPSIVARMEDHIRANNKMLPDRNQRAAILGYLQNSKW